MKVAVEFVTIPRDGEKENGDAVLVRRRPGDAEGVFLAVIDALGHGKLAAEAATVGIAYLQQVPLAQGLQRVVEGLHDRLRGTRGAAAMLLTLQEGRLEGCGVGNVGLRSFGGRVPATLTPGVLGGSMNRLRIFQADVAVGDRLVVFSDGISIRFDEEATRRTPALATCEAIMQHHRKPHDDATVLVADIEAGHDGPAAKPPPPLRDL